MGRDFPACRSEDRPSTPPMLGFPPFPGGRGRHRSPLMRSELQVSIFATQPDRPALLRLGRAGRRFSVGNRRPLGFITCRVEGEIRQRSNASRRNGRALKTPSGGEPDEVARRISPSPSRDARSRRDAPQAQQAGCPSTEHSSVLASCARRGVGVRRTPCRVRAGVRINAECLRRSHDGCSRPRSRPVPCNLAPEGIGHYLEGSGRRIGKVVAQKHCRLTILSRKTTFQAWPFE